MWTKPVCSPVVSSARNARPGDTSRTDHRKRTPLLDVSPRSITKTAGTARVRGSRTRHRILWVDLWVGKLENCSQAQKEPAYPALGPCLDLLWTRVDEGRNSVFLPVPVTCHSRQPLGRVASMPRARGRGGGSHLNRLSQQFQRLQLNLKCRVCARKLFGQ
jgi:hypothetical protein